MDTWPPRSWLSSSCSDWIFSWRSAAFRNAFGDSVVIEFIMGQCGWRWCEGQVAGVLIGNSLARGVKQKLSETQGKSYRFGLEIND